MSLTKEDKKDIEDIVDGKLDPINARLDKIDERFDGIDARLDKIDERFDKMDERFDKMDERFDEMDTRFDRVEGRLDKLEETQEVMKKSLLTIEHEWLPRMAVTLDSIIGLIQDSKEQNKRITHLERRSEDIEIRLSTVEVQVLKA